MSTCLVTGFHICRTLVLNDKDRMLYISLLTLPASEHLCRDILARLASDNLPKSGFVIFLLLFGLLTCSQKLTVFVDIARQTFWRHCSRPCCPIHPL